VENILSPSYHEADVLFFAFHVNLKEQII